MRRATVSVLTAGIVLASVLPALGTGPGPTRPAAGSQDQAPRVDIVHGGWLGPAISYSGYRANQGPNERVYPTKAQVAEDLRILAKHWRLIRIYGSDQHGRDTLEVIREHGIDLEVMLGAWLAKEPGNEQHNRRQVEGAIRLANEYDDIVIAVNVGNEVRVNWSEHPVPEANLIRYIRQVKAAVSVPVTLADNYAWWRDDGANVAKEVDFLTVHTYPVWERRDIDQALAYTIENIESVKRAIPGKTIVIGEAGWPSYTEGNLHVPRAGDERKQQRYYQELTRWAKANDITVFFFEAFDEPWKGTGTEGHWGLFSVDRKAKLCMQKLYSELMPTGPTSPDYSDLPTTPGPHAHTAFRSALAPRLGSGSVNALGNAVPAESLIEDADAADGENSLRFVHNGSDWGGVYLLFEPLDAGKHSKIVLSIKVPDAVTSLEAKIEGPATRASTVNLIDYVTERRPDGWMTCAVPLAKLDQVDASQISVFGLWNPRNTAGQYVAGEIRFDDIHFE